MEVGRFKHVFFRFVRYSAVGIATFLADLSLVAILFFILGFDYLPATIVGFVLAMVGAFFLNRAWTFETHTHLWRIVFAISIGLVSLAIVSWGTYIGVEYLALHYLAARSIAAILATLWSYIADSLITFQVPPFK